MDEYISEIANLATFGWKKEAVPISQTKSSIISRSLGQYLASSLFFFETFVALI